MEKLDRGLVAITTANGVYLSWRLLGDESTIADIKNAPGFIVYKNGSELARVTDSTNYLDAGGSARDSYSVAVIGGEECEAVKPYGSSYFDIKLDKPKDTVLPDGQTYSYATNDASCGDLDGDGEYEIILKWDCNAKDNSHEGYTGNVILDAYKLDGTKLWRIDLGQNIRAGAHYTQFLVYDFDGDGGAELACKTAPGSKDSKDRYVTKASHVTEIAEVSDDINKTSYVNSAGRVLDGDEYYTVFDGDGTAIDTIYYPFPRGNIASWGNNEGYGNRVDRFLGTVAYLDGETPYMISVRGYYGKTTVAAMRLNGGELSVYKTFTTESVGTQYEGQGNHSMLAADVDNDGCDEIITGSICLDNDLSLKWCGGRGHGDAHHIGNYDPTHEGLEYFTVHESGGYDIYGSTTATFGKAADYGMTVYDAATGEELFHEGASSDTGRGVMADIGMGGYYQIWSSGNGLYFSNGGTSFSAGSKNGLSQNFRIFWDGDLYDELLDKTTVTDWNGSGMSDIFTASGCTSVNGTKANPALSADILGDWREELVYPTSDSSALRVYMTTELTEYKLPTLMHDPVYRMGVTAEQTAYNQPPHIGYYISEESFYIPDEPRGEGTRTYAGYITYSEPEYDGFSAQMGTTSLSNTIGNVTYTLAGRGGGGDETTVYSIKKEEDNDYFHLALGRFTGGGRTPYITFSGMSGTSRSYDSVLGMDIRFEYSAGYPVTVRVSDSSGNEIESFSAGSEGIDNGEWYTYKLIYHNGKYYRALYKKGSTAEPKLIKSLTSVYGAARLDLLPTGSTGGDLGKTQDAGISLDNVMLYTNDGIPVPTPTPTATTAPTQTPTAAPATAAPTPTPTAVPATAAPEIVYSEGRITIKGDVPEDAILIEAVYDKDGVMIGIKLYSVFEEIVMPELDGTLKYMLWDGLKTQRPLDVVYRK
ncbi:MAG: rhamnogalacturonan lyase [Clostridia bacterium]|nr:rhamnogalacturonan lyase [Clostridia bacterium]